MKKHIKKIIVILVLLALGYFWYTKFSFTWPQVNNSWNTSWKMVGWKSLETKVEKKDFFSFINVKWTTKIKNEQKLRFNTAGRVTALSVKAWDAVKEWQTLARIDANTVYTEIEKEKLNLENAKNKLKKFVDDIKTSGIKKSNLDIESMKLQLEQKEYNIKYLKDKQKKDLLDAKYSLQEAKNNFEIQKEEAKKNITNLWFNSKDKDKVLREKKLEIEKQERRYNDFKDNFDARVEQKINEYYTKLETNYLNLDSKLTALKKHIEKADSFLGIEERVVKFIQYYSVKNSSFSSKAKSKFLDVYTSYNKMKTSFDAIKDKKDAENIIKTLEISKEFYTHFYEWLNYLVKWFENSVETEGFSASDIAAYTSEFSWYRSDAKANMTSLTSTIDELKNLSSTEKIKKDLEYELESQKNNLEALKVELEKTKEGQNYIVNTSDNNVVSEKIKLEKLQNSIHIQKIEFEKLQKTQKEELRQANIDLEKQKIEYANLLDRRKQLVNLSINTEYKIIKNEVKQAQVTLEDAHKKLENYMLKAPFNGIITKVDMSLGDRLNSDNQKSISMNDPESIQVDVMINQSDIVKVKKWMSVELKLSAYPKKTFSGSIIDIDATPKEENWMTKFPAKVSFEKPKWLKIYSGMKADIAIKVASITDALVIPFTSVMTDESGKNYVTVIWKNGEHQKRMIEVSYTDGKYYQVKKWLQVWEKVLELDYSHAWQYNTQNDNTSFIKWEESYDGSSVEAQISY